MHRPLRNAIVVSALVVCCADPASAQRRFGQLEPERVYASLAQSTEAKRLLDEFDQLIEQDRRFEAARALQKAIDRFPYHPIEVGAGQYADLIRWAHTRIAGDAKLKEAYRAAHGPEATRQRDAALARFDTQTLESIRLRYASAGAGVDAALDLAALDTERAAFDLAHDRLRGLEASCDTEARLARWHTLAATVALYRGDRARFDALRNVVDDRAGQRLDRLAASIAPRRPIPPPAVPPSVATELAESHAAKLDRFDVTGKVQRKRMELDPTWGMLPWGLEVAMWDPLPPMDTATPTNLPVVHGGRVLINTGRSIRLLDAKTIESVWARTFEDRDLVAAARESKRRVLGWHVMDARGVAIDGGMTYGVIGRLIGHPMGDEDEMAGRFGFSLLAALDTDTGAVRWRKRPVEWLADLHDLALHGTPIVLDGRVIVLGHQIADGVHQTTQVLAVDAKTGELLWRRRIATVQENIHGTIASHAVMIAHDHRVYVTDGLGFAIRIDPRSGVADWTSKLLDQPDAEGRTLEKARPSFTRRIGPPALTRAGLIVPMRLESVGAVVVDPATGQRRMNLDGDWQGVRHVATVGDDVIGVSDTAALRCDGKTLTTTWRTALPSEAPRADEAVRRDPFRRPVRRATIGTTRPAVTRSQLLLSNGTRLVVVDLADGSVAASVEAPAAAQLAPLDRSVIVSGNEKVWRLDP